MTKEEIAQNEQFPILPQYFPLLVIGYPFNYKDYLCFDKICSKSSAAELSYEGKGYCKELPARFTLNREYYVVVTIPGLVLYYEGFEQLIADFFFSTP